MKILFLLFISLNCLATPYIIVGAGQSNMSGYEVAIPIPQAYFPNVQLFGNNDVLQAFAEPWDDPTGQIDPVSQDPVGVPKYSLTTKISKMLYAHQPDKDFILVPCPMGATYISQWQQNSSPYTLYGSCLRRINAAITLTGGQLIAYMWYQGEQEATDTVLPFTWVSQFTAMVNALHMDLPLHPSGGYAPIIFAQLPKRLAADPLWSFYPGWDMVRSEQATVSITGVSMINNNDMTMNSNQFHLDKTQYDEMGKRFYNKIAPFIP